MGAAVEFGCDAGVAADHFDIQSGISDRQRHLITAAAGGKRGEAVRKRDFSHRRESGGDTNHVGLGNADVNRAFGENCLKPKHGRGVHQVGVYRANARILFAVFDQQVGIYFTQTLRFQFSCHHCTSCCSSLRIAFCHISVVIPFML